MNTANGGGPVPQSSLLPLVLGALAPAEATDTDLYPADFAPIERASAAVVFRRRTGIIVPESGPAPLVHLGIAPLTRRGLNQGLLGAALAQAGKSGKFLAGGLGRFNTGLFVVDSRGIGPPGHFTKGRWPEDAAELARWAAGQKENLVIDLGGGTGEHANLESFLAALSASDTIVPAQMLLISPIPVNRDRLSAAVLSGPGVQPGLLSSPTTRTPGLIANIDLAPTLLTWLGAPVPATMTGHAIMGIRDSDGLSRLQRLDHITNINARGLAPVGIALGALAATSLAGGLLSLRFRPRAAPTFGFLILAVMNMPLALMLASLLNPPSIPILTVEVFALMLAGAGIETLLARSITVSPCLIVSVITVSTVLLDAVLGGALVRYSLLSGYQVQGIRFYGIGNEYMGVVIGLTLLGVFLSGINPKKAVIPFLAVAFVLGFPRFGAKAGGLVTALTAFGIAWMQIRGRRVTWVSALLWSAAGFAAAFTAAGLEALLPFLQGSAPTHLGGALTSANQLGYGYLVDIVVRKLQMNARILIHPAALAALGVVGGLALLSRSALKDQFDRLARQHPEWSRGLPACGWGALAAFLFNDSGTVAALFLAASFLTSGLAVLFLSPSTPLDCHAKIPGT